MNTKIPMHSRVALRDGVDNVYVYALAGSEGWVRGIKKDDDGFDLIRMEWDTEHWRFNGQPDGWTYADHFYVIGPPVPPVAGAEEDQEYDIIFTPEDEEHFEDVERLPDIPPSESELDRYVEALTEAMDTAAESDGFFMLTVRKIQNPDNPRETMFVPTILQHATSKEASMLIDIQLAECASTNYQDMIFNLMQAMKNDESA